MLTRRALLSGAALGGAPTWMGAETGQESEGIREVARVLENIRDELEAGRTTCAPPICPEVARLRSQQRTFLKSSRKFPTFIEVGIDVWERVHDWQLETRQPIGIGRQPDGSYTLAFGPTTLLLRPDGSDDFIGYPYDNL